MKPPAISSLSRDVGGGIVAMRGQQRDPGSASPSQEAQQLLETEKGLSSQEIVVKPTDEELLKGIYEGVQKMKLKFRY